MWQGELKRGDTLVNAVRESRKAGLPILGILPNLERTPGGSDLSGTAPAEMSEALAGLRLQLARVLAQRPLLMTITSPAPGDGKSLLSAGLAMTLAAAGYRTILLDASMRQGQQHLRFGVSSRPGLSDFLKGDARLWEIVRDTAHACLSVVASGTPTAAGPELLGAERMDTLLHQLSATYQVILCDGPSLAAGVGAYLLCTMTGNLVVVLRDTADAIDFPVGTLHVLSRQPARVVGAVINMLSVSQADLGPWRGSIASAASGAPSNALL